MEVAKERLSERDVIEGRETQELANRIWAARDGHEHKKRKASCAKVGTKSWNTYKVR